MAAQFNMNNKNLGKDMMHVAEKAGVLPDEQDGSQKNKTCIMTALGKVLNFDIVRQLHCALIHLGLDSSQCYDRLLRCVVMLCMLQHGAPFLPLLMMFSTLAAAEHKVTTAYGVSKRGYGGRKRMAQGEIPVQSSGQGNGSGPACYVAYSSTMIKAMRKKGYGAFLQHASHSSLCSWSVLPLWTMAISKAHLKMSMKKERS